MSARPLATTHTVAANGDDRPAELPAGASEDAILYDRFLKGEDAAFVKLHRRHNQRLYLYCLKIVSDEVVAEDLVQEMWERVIDQRRAPQQLYNPLGYFIRIARNLSLDYLKSRRKIVPLDDLTEIPQLAYTMSEPSEMEDLVLRMLDRLPFDHREVLVLNLYCGYRFDEIATMLGKTPDAIWARASRARAQLRKLVAAALPPTTDRNTPNAHSADTE